MAAMEPRMGSIPPAYPSLPASPTLTNPDMILPDYDRTPSPDLDRDGCQALSQSSLMMWQNAHAASSNTDLQQLFSGAHGFTAGPVTPTTPIIYGNGTMLSDIGEVTEVESTVGKPSPSSIRYRSGVAVGARAASPSPRSASPTPQPHYIRNQFHHNAVDDREDFVATPRRTSPADEGGNSSSGTIHQVSSGGGAGGAGSGGGGGGVKKRARQQHAAQEHMRRDSIDSNSTITTHDQATIFADFDDSVSVGDSVFQGDDEESVAESYVAESYVEATFTAHPVLAPSVVLVPASSARLSVPLKGGDPASDINPSDDDRRHSTASISRRAEEILANAKRRLTTMEGNLTRARSSLYVTSPSYGSFPSDGSTPSPRTPVRATSALADSQHAEHAANIASGHARQGSDDSAPSNGVAGPNHIQPRSASALGAAGGYRPPTHGNAQSIEQMRDSLSGGYIRAGHKPAEIALSPLSEDEIVDESGRITHRTHAYSQADIGTVLNSTHNAFSDSERGLARPASVTQMRDLKHQMKDLKGKISSLREQARVDSIKRKSLQSMRTPSPFTYARADPWYAEPHAGQETFHEEKVEENKGNKPESGLWNAALSGVGGDGPEDRDAATPTGLAIPGGIDAALSRSSSTESSRKDLRSDDESAMSGQEYVDAEAEAEAHATPLSYPHIQVQHTELPILVEDTTMGVAVHTDTMDDDLHTEDGSDEDEMVEATDSFSEDSFHEQESVDGDSQTDGYESESGESMYHDTVQQQISHEDREDAFDYEHFILHSALGTISQQRLIGRSRSNSFSSEDSVETTRGPVEHRISDRDPTLERRSSLSSLSTVASFATATEGRQSRPVETADLTEEEEEEESAAATATEGEEGNTTEEERDTHKPFGGWHSSTMMTTKRSIVSSSRLSNRSAGLMQRPATSAAVPGHRPSVSSFESTGTTRSFPLVSRSRLFGSSNSNVWSPGGGIGNGNGNGNGNSSAGSSIGSGVGGHTLNGQGRASSTEELKSISETILSETASICEQAGETGMPYSPRPRSLDSHDNAGQQNHQQAMQMGQAQSLKMLKREDQFLVERLVGSLGQCVLGLTESRVSEEKAIFRRRMEAARRILEGLEPV